MWLYASMLLLSLDIFGFDGLFVDMVDVVAIVCNFVVVIDCNIVDVILIVVDIFFSVVGLK